ncbi:MAG: Asp-tRNA(Asn)/Glu-tRNA(Gln) amidotransferase subunit GatA, partial [Oscillospiraceae bacterium]|nr:Asp-tRNA(Asn)/Glu-tRNA(Gln) amidotransferase subunit GatA [Oscillospiraceae bacterium]
MISIARARAMLDARKISAVELAGMDLEAIERQNPALSAFITVTRETALDAARRADERIAAGGDIPPLCG